MVHDRSTAQTTHQQQDWPAVLDEHRVQFLVFDTHRDRDLAELFQSNLGWKVDYEDRGSVLFARSMAARGWARLPKSREHVRMEPPEVCWASAESPDWIDAAFLPASCDIGVVCNMSKNGRVSNTAFKGMALWLKLRERSLGAQQRLADAGVGPGQVVLDYGCGIGSYTIPAAQIVGARGRVYALDIHPLAIERVERRARKENLANIKTIRSGLDTSLAANSVDVVLLYDVLHSVPDHQALLQELYRVLVPEGRLSVLPDHMTDDELLSTMNDGKLFGLQAQHGEVFELINMMGL